MTKEHSGYMFILLKQLMNLDMTDKWTWTLSLITALIAGYLMYRPICRMKSVIVNQYKTMKLYWLFTVAYIFIMIATYTTIFYLKPQNISDVLSVANTSLSILFGIFVGYFAFLQVVDSRFSQLSEKGITYLGQKEYVRAIKLMEEAFKIRPRDFDNLANLLEAYVIVGQYDKFSDYVGYVSKSVIEEQDRVIEKYLRSANYLMRGMISDAKISIKECISLVDSNSELTINWSFGDLSTSDSYTKLSGDIRKIFDNFIKFLNKQLTEDERKKFISGNFTLEALVSK